VLRAYENIIEVIKGRSNKKSIDYYEAVRIAYTESKYMQKHFESVIKDSTEINKGFKPIWEFTYRIVNEEKERVRVVNKNPDNLLVSWVLGGVLGFQLQKLL
jgi:hypothetical protein